jgi:transposase-like protein
MLDVRMSKCKLQGDNLFFQFRTDAPHRVIDSCRSVSLVAKELFLCKKHLLYKWVRDESESLEKPAILPVIELLTAHNRKELTRLNLWDI